MVEKISSGDEEVGTDDMSSSRIKEMLQIWEKLKNFVENHDPKLSSNWQVPEFI